MKKFALMSLGSVMVLAGYLFGTQNLAIHRPTDMALCGSVFNPNTIGRSTDLVMACRDKLGNQRILAWGLIGLGAAVVVGSLFMPAQSAQHR